MTVDNQRQRPLVFIALLHSPIVNRHGQEVVTAVTNLDLHDIARSCKTYGITKYFVVNPEDEQERLVHQILKHWKQEVSIVHHPSRAEALDLVEFVRTFEEVFNEITRLCGQSPCVAMPDAKQLPEALNYTEMRELFEAGDKPLLLVFGTGWGIAPQFYKNVDYFLKPIYGSKNTAREGKRYNHLSVRAAAAIILDRLFGEE